MNGLWGTYTSALDSKGRINIPVKVRNNLIPDDKNTFMLIRGKEGKYIVMRPLSRWEEYMQSVEQKLGNGKKYEIFSRHLMKDGSLQILDKQGRINLTKKLIDYAELDGEVQIHTYKDRLEIWMEENYENFLNSTLPEAEKISDEHDL
jgi:MraZ protein